jgi:hypothetical protein
LAYGKRWHHESVERNLHLVAVTSSEDDAAGGGAALRQAPIAKQNQIDSFSCQNKALRSS